jgi:pimeloyl-ACP methyl ester carboxylesterase
MLTPTADIPRRGAIGAAMLSSLALAALAICASPAAARPMIELTPCTLPGVAEPLRCGAFHVPEDRAKPTGRILSLRVVVVPARAASPREPIFVLSGGPGQGAAGQAGGYLDGALRREHDIVLVDLRGTGASNRLDCRPGAPGDLQAYLAPIFSDRALIKACRDALSKRADLALYTTPIAMQDLDEVRQALGHAKINLYGGSYGSRAGIVYMRAYPARVRAAVFMSLAPLSARSPLPFAAAVQRAFDSVIGDCRAEPACKDAYPDPHADLAAILARLKQEPVRVELPDPVTGAPASVLLTDAGFGDGLRAMLYSSGSGRRVPLLLQRARAGDYAPFAVMALALGRNLSNGLATGLTLSVSCPEDVARIRPEEVAPATVGSFVGDRRVRDQMAACEDWPQNPMPAGYFRDYPTTIPTVLVSGRLDPATPPSLGEEMARSLPNSIHLLTPAGHSEQGDCIDSIAAELFRTASVQGLDTSCVGAMKLPLFVLPDQAAAAH